MRFYFVEKLEATEAEQQNGNVICVEKFFSYNKKDWWSFLPDR